MIDGGRAERLHNRPSAHIPESKSLAVPAVPFHIGSVAHAGHSTASTSVSSFVGSIRSGMSRVVCLIAVAILLLLSVNNVASFTGLTVTHLGNRHRSTPRRIQDSAQLLLRVFQVYPPVLTVSPTGRLELSDGSDNESYSVGKPSGSTCVDVLVEYSFANSYGHPFVGAYAPPKCSFNRVTWNLTVISAGRQFDRLGIVYLGDIEVFRTSTAEPTADGIIWTYLKDMTPYLSLFLTDQKIIFDLGNLINDIYTAPFNVTLTGTYFTATDSIVAADAILPISAQGASEDKPSAFVVPPNTASSNLTIPQNVKKAVLTIAATGQIDEEFWWSNVLQSDVNTYLNTTLYGLSPFREVQLFIDGALAGVAWPFPIIFTGGVVPGLWRPIVGIDAFDLKEDEIDITPFLPLLCDGQAHNYSIRVSGLIDDGNGNLVLSESTGSYWIVTGKVFLWLDEDGHVTTGQGPNTHAPRPNFEATSSISKTSNGTNGTLLYHVSAQRRLSFHSTLNLSHGKEAASWQQHLTYSNDGNFSDGANIEINNQQTSGVHTSSSGYVKSFEYPLYAYSVYRAIADNFSITADVHRGQVLKTLGQGVFPTGVEPLSVHGPSSVQYPNFQGALLSTWQNGSAVYLANTTSQTSFSFGTTAQDFTLEGIRVNSPVTAQDTFPHIAGFTELFQRHVKAVNGTVVEDEQTLLGQSTETNWNPYPGAQKGYVLTNIPGRGGEWSRKGLPPVAP